MTQRSFGGIVNQGHTYRLLGIAAVCIAGAMPATALTLRCPPDSVKVGNVCIDTYEASIWRLPPSNPGLIRRVQRGWTTLAVSPTKNASQMCGGDCDNNGTVTVDEIVTRVNIALGSLSLDLCPRFDCNGIGRVTVDCIVKAVDAALNGCDSSTPTPTSTATPTSMPSATSSAKATVSETATQTAIETATAISTPTETTAPSPTSPRAATASATATRTATASPPSTPSATRPPIDEAALAASARVATEPILRLFDFQARVGSPGGVAGRSIVSGCQQFDCVASGHVTGTEEDCCSERQFTQIFDNCILDDDLGRFVRLSGAFALDSDNVAVCTGAIPVGADFTASLSNFTHDVFFPDGSFSRTFQELTETFEVTPGGCTVRQPEQFGFGIRGDGRRLIDGELQQFQSDGSGKVLVDTEFDVHALEIVVGSTGQPDSCTVTAAVNGSLTSADFRARTQFSTDLTDFHALQPPQAGALLLELNGTVGTDCLGDLTLSTVEPLRVAPGDACFTAGRLQTQRQDETVSVTYADSGLDLDFGADGSLDQHFSTCTDVPADQCSTSVVGLCGACTAFNQCQRGLGCFPCSASCSGNTMRCSLPDTFATCEDGVF
jgi:hypothetical protein